MPLPRFAEGINTALLNALFWESEKCATVMDRLSQLRRALSRDVDALKDLHELRTQIDATRGAMLAFADLFPIYPLSVEDFLNHLDIALPSISQTLDDIQILCGGRCNEKRWYRMWDIMWDKTAGKFEIDDRFKIYARFFELLADGLTQSTKFEWKKAEALRLKIMDLREADGQELPQNSTTVFFPFNQLSAVRSPSRPMIKHWAEETMERKAPYWSLFGKEGRSESFGPYMTWDRVGIPEKSRMLFRRPFRNDELSLTLYNNHRDRMPYLLIRTTFNNIPYFENRALYEIRITRDDTRLHFTRWSARRRTFVPWAVLHFDIFEELVVTHLTLLSLKGQTSFGPDAITHDEAIFRDDSRIWESEIKDNGIKHKLAIYRDHLTGTTRLYACVAKGERVTAYTPAWTIFFTNRNQRPLMECVGDYRLVIYKASLHTFGDRYLTAKHDPRHFEIQFRHKHDAREVKSLFEAAYRAHKRRTM